MIIEGVTSTRLITMRFQLKIKQQSHTNNVLEVLVAENYVLIKEGEEKRKGKKFGIIFTFKFLQKICLLSQNKSNK